ncbi:MAG: T9SS type A sorting domain-containing protein [Bacteroidales bacterium]
MNSLIKVWTALCAGMLLLPALRAQEVVLPLFDNPAAARARQAQEIHRKSAAAVMLTLPFFEDFSRQSGAPDPERWSDDYAFVNNNFSVEPVTNGVATLDALDADGSIYPGAVLDPNTFVADTLTSQPVALDYPASDSIYLSFLYQPAGLCDPPEDQDSLMVDFFAPDSARWINVWSVPGSELQPFRQVMLPVTDSSFLKEGFRFRFRNRASLARNNDYPDMRSNVDYWHIDYVKLDRNRFIADTVLRDVAFNTPLNSVLKNLTALPWSHFEVAYNTALDQSAFARYRNNDTITRNVTRSLSILEPYYNEIHTPAEPTAQDLPALQDTIVEFGYIFPLDFQRGDSALLRFRAALRTDEMDPKVNDTVVHDQIFSDYYAYDDGTPEAGYGLRGGGTSNGMVAVKYHSYAPDMLGGVYVLFNHVYDSLNLGYYFKLMVWAGAEGKPGALIWEDENDHTPRYSGSYTGLVRYDFSQPVPVDGDFYVGWFQYNQYLLNVGLDLNSRPSPAVMYYNIQGQWEPSEAPGVIMFRPFLYDESTGVTPVREALLPLTIYPNPASERIYFNWPSGVHPDRITVEVYDAAGRAVDASLRGDGSMDVSPFAPGIYYLRVHTEAQTFQSKLMISR